MFVVDKLAGVAAATAATVEFPHTTTGSVVAAVLTVPEGVKLPIVE